MLNNHTGTVEHATVEPTSALSVLLPSEVNALCAAQNSSIYELFKNCALAVLTSGNETDDAESMRRQYAAFDVKFEQSDRGIVVHLLNAPAVAFVDGELIVGLEEHLFSVLRDIVFIQNELEWPDVADEFYSARTTEGVFRILRHANAVRREAHHGLVVCWGGHAISREEYDYSKTVGYELGLRGLDICTGCGMGAMKGPMKGATIGHAKQRVRRGRYVGLSEPGIIAAEAPNAIVNELIVLPDIEKRLEAFVRLAHGIVIFPGGVGTAEEILYLLSILASPRNAGQQLPIVLTGPADGAAYFKGIVTFIEMTLGPEYASRLAVHIDDPAGVARRMRIDVDRALAHRDATDDAQYFNWSLAIDPDLQVPFVADHEAMAGLTLSRDLPAHQLGSNLRRAFSGIVAGNVKETGIESVRKHGPFELSAEPQIAAQLATLLHGFVADKRMRLFGKSYEPCYRIV